MQKHTPPPPRTALIVSSNPKAVEIHIDGQQYDIPKMLISAEIGRQLTSIGIFSDIIGEVEHRALWEFVEVLCRAHQVTHIQLDGIRVVQTLDEMFPTSNNTNP